MQLTLKQYQSHKIKFLIFTVLHESQLLLQWNHTQNINFLKNTIIVFILFFRRVVNNLFPPPPPLYSTLSLIISLVRVTSSLIHNSLSTIFLSFIHNLLCNFAYIDTINLQNSELYILIQLYFLLIMPLKTEMVFSAIP